MLPLSEVILFITPPSAFTAYTATRINGVTQHYPLLSYRYLSSYVKQYGFKTAVLDLGIEKKPWLLLPKVLEKLRPRIIAMTCTTPLFYEVRLIGMIAKAVLGSDVCIVVGGIHVSALPQESLTETMCDVAILDEGEVTFKEICEGRPFGEINGIVYRKDKARRVVRNADKIIGDILNEKPLHLIGGMADDENEREISRTLPRRLMTNTELDALPFADLDLYNIYRYKNTRVISKGYPMMLMETSRGCPFHCNFCSADDAYRVMSPRRVIEEMKEFKRRGIKEVRFVDDQFATNMKRAKKIFELMLQEGLWFHMNLGNGVRADRIDLELLELGKRAGLYQVGIGFESGDQAALDSMQKGLKNGYITGVKCMETFRQSGLETVGFFIFGAPGDTEESLNRTIAYAKELRPDFAKVTIVIPFPDTRLFADYEKRGLIRSRQWDLYNIHKAVGVYRHPNGLSPELLSYYYNLFYREYYLNPSYLLMKLRKSITTGSFFSDIITAAKTFFPTVFPNSPRRRFKIKPIFIWHDIRRALFARPESTGQITSHYVEHMH